MKRIFLKIAVPAVFILLGLCIASMAAAKQEVYFYNWSEYLPEDVIRQFTKETGIKVIYTTYDSNEAMYAKIRLLDGKGYDLVVPSGYFVNKMAREGLLLEIDKSRLNNFKNLDARHTDRPFDPGNRYSIPYLWGSTGIIVNSAEIDPATVRSWADLWKPEFKGKVLLLNDVRDVFFMSLRVLGLSGNTTDPDEIRLAYDKLVLLMPNVRLFNSDTPRVPYITGEVSVGQIWNGEAFMAAEESEKFVYIYPSEGAILWMDNLVIPKRAENVDNAHALMDFLLRPDIAKAICEEIGYASPNREAVKLLDEDIRNNRTIYPTKEDLAGSDFQVDIGEAVVIYESYWEKLKTGR
jgi:spermidine/putrescine transport system substrate-binding protein